MAGMPQAVAGYRLFCWVNAALNAALAAAGVALVALGPRLAPDPEFDLEWRFLTLLAGAAFAIIGAVFAAANLWLPGYRGKRAWEVHVTNLVLATGSIVLIPVSLPVLLRFFDDEVRAYYGAS